MILTSLQLLESLMVEKRDPTAPILSTGDITESAEVKAERAG